MFSKIAPQFYLTPLGFVKAAIAFASRDQKSMVDLFHLRQSLGLYITVLIVYLLFKMFDTDLSYGEPVSLITLAGLMVLWFLGFKSAMEGKTSPIPLLGLLYQKLFSFIG
jgi:hypothetical protein